MRGLALNDDQTYKISTQETYNAVEKVHDRFGNQFKEGIYAKFKKSNFAYVLKQINLHAIEK